MLGTRRTLRWCCLSSTQQTLNATGARGADPSFAGEAGRSVYGKPSTDSSTNASFSSPSSSSSINAISGSGGNSNSQKSFIPSGDTVSTQRLAGRIGEILQAERDNSFMGHRVFNKDYAPYYNFGTFG